MKHFIGQTRNDKQVYVQLIGSRAGRNVARQPQLLALAREMLAKTSLRDAEVRMEYDMKRPVGYNFIVETSDKDTIFYARLLKDDVYTRFVKNGKPLSTNYVSATLLLDDDGTYQMTDIWVGRLTPPLPGRADETSQSKPYWATHALVMSSQSLQLKTITKECPY